MKTPFKLTFLICSVLFVSCKQRGPEDKAFQNYMSQSLRQTIPAALHYYILVPSNQCEGCILWDASKFKNTELSNRVTVISAFPQKHFKNFANYLYDKNDEMLKLKFLQYRNCIVTTKDKHVLSLTPITDVYRQVDSLNNVFDK